MDNSIKRLKEILLTLPLKTEKSGEQEVFRIFTKELELLNKRRLKLSEEDDKKLMKEFQRSLLSFIRESTFCRYVFDKPRGYAGDYKTQEMIWNAQNGNKNFRYTGSTPTGKLLSSMTFAMDNPKANIARIHFIKQRIIASKKRIASIGCGSCIELWDMGAKILKKKNIFLLDQDQYALIRAKKKLSLNSMETITFVHENVLKFIAINRDKNLLGSRDFIYIIGLLDYFNIKSSKKIVAALWENVAPGGSLLFTNAHHSNPTKTWMEYGGEWFLLYKNKTDMIEIINGLPNLKEIKYHLDEYKVYQYMEVFKIE